MWKTPDELDAEMAARQGRHDVEEEQAAIDHAEEVEAAKHPHHDGILHKLEGMLDRSSETELRTDAER